jgi:hypothetical protein
MFKSFIFTDLFITPKLLLCVSKFITVCIQNLESVAIIHSNSLFKVVMSEIRSVLKNNQRMCLDCAKNRFKMW